MSTPSISDKTLNRMTQCAFMAQHQSQNLLNPNEALNSALQLLNTCNLSQDQKDKIEEILKSPCSNKAQEATDKMKERIFIVLSGQELTPCESELQIVPIIQNNCSNSANATPFFYSITLCYDVFSKIFFNCNSVHADYTSARALACTNKFYSQYATKFWEQLKKNTFAHLNQVKIMDFALHDHYKINPFVINFDLDALLENLSTDPEPSHLSAILGYACTFLNWASISKTKEDKFADALEKFDGIVRGQQEKLIKTQLSKMCSYFVLALEDVVPGSAEAEILEAHYHWIVDKIIDGDHNCIDQQLAQVQEMMLEIAVGVIDFSCTKEIAILQAKAGHALLNYKMNLLKMICCRQNPNEHHTVDLELLIKQKLAPALGLTGSIFNTGPRYGSLIQNVDARAQQVLDAFLNEYKPLEFLMNQICSHHMGTATQLRNPLLEWAVEQFCIETDHSDDSQATDMNSIFSVNFDPDAFHDFANGGDMSLAAAFFILEAAGIIKPK